MIPKIRVRPAASMNSRSPYWTLFRSWIRKLAKSMRAGAGKKMGGVNLPRESRRAASGVHLAAGARVGQCLGRDAEDLVLALFHAAQVDVLHRVVRLAHRPLAARAVDGLGLQRLVQGLLVAQVALHGSGALRQ